MGAIVVAVARGQDKVRLLQDEGADAVIDSSNHTTVASLAGAIKAAAPKGLCVWHGVSSCREHNASLHCGLRSQLLVKQLLKIRLSAFLVCVTSPI